MLFFNSGHFFFFFYGAYILPYVFRIKMLSAESIMYFMMLIIVITVIYYYDSEFVVICISMAIIMTITMLANIRTVEKNELKKTIYQQNKQINILIAEQERNRISQDLHDTLGHMFASLSVKSELALKLIDKDIEQAKMEMTSVNTLSKAALVKVREIVDDLQLQSFEDEVKAVQTLLKSMNISLEFYNIECTATLSPTKQSRLAMILREAVNNVIKHAQATKVVGQCIEKEKSFIMIIRDNGVGMEKAKSEDLQSIYQRVQAMDGRLDVQSHLNEGLELKLTLPRGDDC
ncbi:sensor histidine kinase [Staphylococcus sp. 17KM0847]|uniref:sensor histidine kinase n=1 Tax=Staphylococcus sp. 17KM0847 TaxID=2583989 RepID=UPI002155A433|nr:sensor histidine kinase [Staphylococcus sp. 17KM0847]